MSRELCLSHPQWQDVLDKAKQDANYWAVRALCQWKVITEATTDFTQDMRCRASLFEATVHGKELRLVKVSCGFFREASDAAEKRAAKLRKTRSASRLLARRSPCLSASATECCGWSSGGNCWRAQLFLLRTTYL